MDDDDYWNSSETKAYSFDDDVLSPQEILAIGRPSGSYSQNTDNILTNMTVAAPTIPLSSIISPKALDLILLAQSGTDSITKDSEVEESVPTTLKRLVLGRTSSLHTHRSLKSKTELLDGAVAIGDGNAILSVVLFLIQTLNKRKVYELLSSRPLALNHYITFLHTEGKISELTDLLTMLGKSPEAAMYQFQHQVKSHGNNVDILIRKLNNTLSNHFDQPGVDLAHVKMLTNYIKLLEWQKCVNNPDLNNKSTIECLAHCCANNWNEGAGKMMSPLTLCQQQQINPLQYDWVVLNVHSKLKNWDIVESLFTRKDWLGRSTMSSHIPLPIIIVRLNELNASKQLLASFINRISDTDERLEIAKQFKVHSVVIETLAKQKDRVSMTSYKINLNPQSEEYILAENTLRNPVKEKDSYKFYEAFVRAVI